MLQEALEYVRDNAAQVTALLVQHVQVSALALACALVLGLALGFACWRFGRAGRAVQALFQVLRVIPSLAILLLLIPVLGTGTGPAVVALVLLAMPPILLSTVQGLAGTPASSLEAAEGLGMTAGQTFTRVRMLLALPVVFAGVKTAAIEVVASATLAAKIGAGGLGELIFTGLGLLRMDLVLVGGVLVAALSLTVGLLLDGLEKLVVRWRRVERKGGSMRALKRGMTAAIACLCTCIVALSLVGCMGEAGTSGLSTSVTGAANNPSARGPIKVGSKDFTESMVVSEVYALALEDAGYQVWRVPAVASSVIHASIINGEVDLYPEYTGTGLLSVLQARMITDPQEAYDAVKAAYNDQFNITWLNYAQANDGQGLVIRTSVAREKGIATISDLQQHASELNFASQGEFDQRADGMPALQAAYGPFEWASSKVFDNGLKYQVLASGEADVAPAYTTEGQLVNTEEFTLLEDNLQVWPPYNLAPIVRNDALEATPGIADALSKVSAQMDTATVTRLNAQVDVEKREYEDVAREFYESIS